MSTTKPHINKNILLQTYWYWLPLVLLLFGHWWLQDKISIGLNPDLTSYFAIARHYANLQGYEGLNAYWSPLMSWMLVPFFWMRLDPLLSMRLLMLFISIGVFLLSVDLIRMSTVRKAFRFATLLIVVFLNLYYALSAQTPDFVSVFTTLFFIGVLLRVSNNKSSWMRLAISVLLCFFSKSFLLPFAICMTVLFVAYKVFYEKEKGMLKQSWTFALVLAVGLSTWAGLMKYRYGSWMLSSAYAYNTTVFGPGGDQAHYTSYASLIDPPSPHATFGWQDPTLFNVTPVYFWTSSENFSNQVQTWKRNFTMWPYLFRYFSWFSYGVLVIPLVVLLSFRQQRFRIGVLLYLGFLILLCAYTLVFIKERYLAPGHYLLVLSMIPALEALRSKAASLLRANISPSLLTNVLVGMLSVLLLIGFIKNPIQQIRFCMNEKSALDEEIKLAYELNLTGLLDHRKVATFTSASGLYNYMPLACLLSEASFYGELNIWKSSKEQEEELHSKGIELFLYNGCSNMDSDGNCLNEEMPLWLTQYPVVYENKRFKVKVLDLRMKQPLRREEELLGSSY